eukprot:1192486-Prorocentrum_minimum.AAC.3
MLGGRAMVGGAPPPMVVFCNSLTYRSSNAHLTKRSGPPGPGWSTGLEAPRWAAWRTGLRASLYGVFGLLPSTSDHPYPIPTLL